MNRVMTVGFAGKELYAFEMGGIIFVALKPIVEGMGLDWSAQFRKVQRMPILAEGVAKMAMPFGPGNGQPMICLRMNLIHGWLLTINSTQVRAELRGVVEMYQRECYDVLYAHFSGDRDRLLKEANETMSLNLRLCTECRHIHGNFAAAQLWDKLHMPKVPAMDQVLRQRNLFDWPDEEKKAA